MFLPLHADELVVNSAYEQAPQPAVLNLPSSQQNGQKRSTECIFHGLEGHRLTIETNERPAISSVVSVECNDAMFLGEILSCVQSTGGSWRASVRVEQVLTGLQSLMNLRERLLGESSNARKTSRTLTSVCA